MPSCEEGAEQSSALHECRAALLAPLVPHEQASCRRGYVVEPSSPSRQHWWVARPVGHRRVTPAARVPPHGFCHRARAPRSPQSPTSAAVAHASGNVGMGMLPSGNVAKWKCRDYGLLWQRQRRRFTPWPRSRSEQKHGGRVVGVMGLLNKCARH